MMKSVSKGKVFISMFAVIAGSLLIFASYFEKLAFKPSIDVKKIVLTIKEDESKVDYALSYTIKEDRKVAVKVKNEFFDLKDELSSTSGDSYYFTGSFTSLTSKAEYNFIILENNIEVYKESFVLSVE